LPNELMRTGLVGSATSAWSDTRCSGPRAMEWHGSRISRRLAVALMTDLVLDPAGHPVGLYSSPPSLADCPRCRAAMTCGGLR